MNFESTSTVGLFIGVTELYQEVLVYQEDAFIYTHLFFLFPFSYRMLVMGATFQTSGNRNTMLETMFHKPFCLSLVYPSLVYCHDWHTVVVYESHVFPFTVAHIMQSLSSVLNSEATWCQQESVCSCTHSHCAESTAWQVEPVSVFSLKQTNLHCPDSGKQRSSVHNQHQS